MDSLQVDIVQMNNHGMEYYWKNSLNIKW